MFLTCPQCETHFSVPDTALLPDGKKVRCSICKHTWFQQPVEEEDIDLRNNDDADESDFLSMLRDESRRQALEGKEEDEEGEEDGFPKSLKRATAPEQPDIIFKQKRSMAPDSLITGIAASVALFIIMSVLLITVRGPVTNVMPSANAFYSAFGFKPRIEGRGLVFHDIESNVENDLLLVKAKISNLGIDEANLPKILAEQLDEQGNTLVSWIIEPSFKSIIGGGTESFTGEYGAQPETVSLRLSLVVKQVKGNGRKGIRSKASQATQSQEAPVDTNDEADVTSATPESAPSQEGLHSSPAH